MLKLHLQLQILLQFYDVTHPVRLYRLCMINNYNNCINCIHLSDLMSIDDKAFICTLYHCSSFVLDQVVLRNSESITLIVFRVTHSFCQFIHHSERAFDEWPTVSLCLIYHSTWCMLMCNCLSVKIWLLSYYKEIRLNITINVIGINICTLPPPRNKAKKRIQLKFLIQTILLMYLYFISRNSMIFFYSLN